jgi:HSP20 family protein
MLVHVRERHPHDVFWGLDRDIDRLFRSFWSDRGVPAGSGGFRYDVTPDADGATIRAEVPGVEPSAIKIDVDGRTLTISGERAEEKRTEGRYRVRERRFGKFSRSFELTDDLDASNIDASSHDGVLTVRIAKRPEAKPRQIEVKAS